MSGASGHLASHFTGVAVGHSGDEVDYAQEGCVQRSIRTGRAVAQQVKDASMLERWRTPAELLHGRAAESVEQNLQRGIGADLVQRLALVLKDLLARHVLGAEHAAFGRTVHVLDQIAVQGAGQQRVLLLDESPGRGVGQVLDGLAAQDRQLAPPGVARPQLPVGFRQIVAYQAQQQGLDFGIFEQVHFQTVLKVDQRIADVVGGLHQIHQRMARPAFVLQLRHAQARGDLFENGQLALIAAELVFLVAQRVRVARGPGVLQISAERGIGQSRATVEMVVFELRQDAEALGVALEIEEILAFGLAHSVEPATPGGLGEPVANRIFAGMPERRVANVMRQASRLDHHAQVTGIAPVGQGGTQGLADSHAQRAADAAHFQRVGQAGVDVVVAGNRVDLGLAPQAAKGSGKDDPVVILVKRAAAEFFGAVKSLAQALAVEQGLPIQGVHSIRS